jgi:HEAT repeat protein
MTQPSLELLQSAVLVLSLSALTLALGVYLLMHVRHYRQLARETRRSMLANFLSPAWDAPTIQSLWSSRGRSDREILAEVLIARRQSLEAREAGAFEQEVAAAGITEHWVRQLRRGLVSRRVRAAINLGYFHEARGVEALVAAAEDPSPEVELAVALSLGRLRDPEGLPGLMRLTQKPPSVIPDLTLAAALAACAQTCPKRLAGLLEAPQERSRIIGAWALSEVSDSAVLPQLLMAARDAHPEVRAKVARALARLSDRTAVEALNGLARDPRWFVRVRALDALGKLHASAGEAAALAGLGDEMREVRYRAAYTLREIAGMKSQMVVKVLTAGSPQSFESLMSEWERAGFLWGAVAQLSTRDWARFQESRELLRTLVAAGVTRALVNFVRVFPDLKVRLRLVRLLAGAPDPRVRADLLALAHQPGCDRRVAAAIRAHLPGAEAGLPTGVGVPPLPN